MRGDASIPGRAFNSCRAPGVRTRPLQYYNQRIKIRTQETILQLNTINVPRGPSTIQRPEEWHYYGITGAIKLQNCEQWQIVLADSLGRYCHFDWPILDHYNRFPPGLMIKRVSSKIAFDHNQDTTFSFSLVFLASEAARPRQKVNFITWLRVRLYNRFMRHFRLFTLVRVVPGPLIPVLSSDWSALSNAGLSLAPAVVSVPT